MRALPSVRLPAIILLANCKGSIFRMFTDLQISSAYINRQNSSVAAKLCVVGRKGWTIYRTVTKIRDCRGSLEGADCGKRLEG